METVPWFQREESAPEDYPATSTGISNIRKMVNKANDMIDKNQTGQKLNQNSRKLWIHSMRLVIKIKYKYIRMRHLMSVMQ